MIGADDAVVRIDGVAVDPYGAIGELSADEGEGGHLGRIC